MSSIGDISKKLGRKISDNSPVILTSMAVGGVVSTAYFTATATAKSVHRLYAEGAYDEEVWEEQTFLDRAKIVWPNYIPPVVIGATTIGCIIGGHGVHTRRQAALMSLYSVTETAFSEYRDKVVEVIGEKEEQKVRDDIAQDQVQTHVPPRSSWSVPEVIFVSTASRLDISRVLSKTSVEQRTRSMLRSSTMDTRLRTISIERSDCPLPRSATRSDGEWSTCSSSPSPLL